LGKDEVDKDIVKECSQLRLMGKKVWNTVIARYKNIDKDK
jgi:hypothetical protein